jgi:F-type H+-transporting ATPase subunit c
MIELTGCMLAAGEAGSNNLALFGAAIACALAIIGAAMGIGLIGSKSAEAMARQPQIGGRILTAMIIAAALIEGLTFFALIICFLAIFWMKG